jgi:1,4-alpha-glucan branching enzyme
LVEANKDSDDWNRESHPMKKDAFGVWELVLPARNGEPAIQHNSKIKVTKEIILAV